MNLSFFCQMRRALSFRYAVFLPLASFSLLIAQETTTLHVDVKAVTVAATVRDKHGQIVSNLTKDDFVLTDDTHPQTINYFAHDANLPLNLGLLVDTSMSQRNVLSEERTASQHFLDQMLTNEKDKAALIQFDREVDLLVDLTPSKDKLRNGLDQLGNSQSGPSFGSSDDPDQNSGRRRGGGGTTLYDAIYLASNEVFNKQADRKALIVLTDGADRGSKETLNEAIESAQRANTIVYAIYFKGEESGSNGNPGGMGRRGGMGGGWPGGGGGWPGSGGGGGGRGGGQPRQESHVDGKKILEQICDQTGGHMFEAKKDKVDQVYSFIAEDLRNQYILGYTPDKSNSDTGYHKISLTTKKSDLHVQAREGYYLGQ